MPAAASGGAAVAAGIDALGLDMDGDGIANALESGSGTNPMQADSDDEGVLDGIDAYPLDPTRTQAPGPVVGDTLAPQIFVTAPISLVP